MAAPMSAYCFTNLGTRPFDRPHEIVPDEHLTVARGAGADADRRDGERLGDEGGDRWRNRFQHEGETAGSFQRAGGVDKAARLDGGTTLRLVPTQQLHRLRVNRVADERNRGIDDRFGTT